MAGLTFLAFCFAVTAAVNAEAAQKIPTPAPSAAILAFGDSLTFGTGAPAGRSYPAVLEKLLSRKVINAGIPGETTGSGLARLPHLLDKHNPSLLLLCHGANDLMLGYPEQQIADNIRQMIRLAEKRGARVVLIGVPYPANQVSQPEFYGAIARESNLPFARDALAKVLNNPTLKADFIHPNARGYRKMAENLAVVIRKCCSL